ncbi:MAG TPA: P1 family peptidase [Thermomicrobiales bacterium]|nr:P1 family peptidase [Thermomicrobiales bacterium]
MEILTSGFRTLDGVRIGNWTDRDAQTGCTVILFDAPALTAAEIRGAAPGTREVDLLRPGMTVQRPDAILLTGGSAFGLAAADGVMRWLQERGRGFPTPAGPVPIVPAAVIFDLAIGEPVAPDATSGYIATDNAVPLDQLAVGRVGAGTGTTHGRIGGSIAIRAGGFAVAQVALPEGTVMALVVLNAYGSLAGADSDPRVAKLDTEAHTPPFGQSTTLLACLTDIPLDHASLQRMTVAMHDGLARAVAPVHTVADGDIAFATTLLEDPVGPVDRGLRVSIAAELAVEASIGTLAEGT